MKYFIGIILAFSFFNAKAQIDTVILDGVIASVGDNIILLSEVEERYRAKDIRNDDDRCKILDELLTENVLLVQAELDSILVADEELESQLDARIEQILRMMNYDRNQFISYYGKTPEAVKESFRDDLKRQLTVQKMQQEIIQGVSVTPTEVKEFFAQIPKSNLPFFNSEVEVGEIVIEPKPNDKELANAKNQLESIRNRIINGGEDFAALAKQYSEDPGSGRNGGDLGWGKRGSYVTEFEATAYQLETNEISEVIKTEFGFHILQLLERRGNLVHLRHILIKPRITKQDKELAYRQLDTIRNLIVTDSIHFAYAVNKYSSDKVQSKTNAGLMLNNKSGNSTFEVADLDPSIYFAIDTMEIDDISAPMYYTDPQSGEELVRIIWLRSRTSPHQANLEEDYAKIQAAAIEQKKATHLSEWIDEHVEKMYINIDTRYDNCENLKKWNKDSKQNP